VLVYEFRVTADAIQESFNVFIQILVSQSLEPTFLGALLQEPGKILKEFKVVIFDFDLLYAIE